MLFKNKETNVVWDIQSPKHIKRCSNDTNYAKGEENPEKHETNEQPKEDTPKQETNKTESKSTTEKKTDTKQKKSTSKK